MTKQELQARETLSKCTIKQLVGLWQESEKQTINAQVATVRGWIMAAMERRNPEAFDKWIETDDVTVFLQ